MPKKIERGDSLVSPGMVCYAEKQVKPFWSTSLGQMVQFDTIIFCRTFKNYFGQFVWIEKKRVTIIVAFHFMKRRLKNVLTCDSCQSSWQNFMSRFVEITNSIQPDETRSISSKLILKYKFCALKLKYQLRTRLLCNTITIFQEFILRKFFEIHECRAYFVSLTKRAFK